MKRAAALAPRPPSEDLLGEVAQAFQPYSPDPLTRDDAREIVDTLTRSMAVLERWAWEDAAKGKGPFAHLLAPDADEEKSP